jgi:cytochrome P450 family 4
MFAISCVILVLMIFTWYQLKYGHRNQLLSKTPSPKKLPIIHNILEVIGMSPEQIFAWMEENNTKFGNVWHSTFEPFDNGTFIVSNCKVVEGILTSQKHLSKSFEYDLLKPWLGTGLLISTGNKWRQRRKILTPAFHFQILEKFVDVMDENGDVLIEKLKSLNEQEIDIHPLLNHYALDVICGEFN